MIYKGGGVSNKEKEEYSQAIRRNVIDSIQVSISGSPDRRQGRGDGGAQLLVALQVPTLPRHSSRQRKQTTASRKLIERKCNRPNNAVFSSIFLTVPQIMDRRFVLLCVAFRLPLFANGVAADYFVACATYGARTSARTSKISVYEVQISG